MAEAPGGGPAAPYKGKELLEILKIGKEKSEVVLEGSDRIKNNVLAIKRTVRSIFSVSTQKFHEPTHISQGRFLILQRGEKVEARKDSFLTFRKPPAPAFVSYW